MEKKKIGVLCKNRRDFVNYIKGNCNNIIVCSASKIITDDVIYIALYIDYRCRGFNLNEIIETDLAYENKSYDKLKEYSSACLFFTN